MKIFPRTIKELQTITTVRALRALIIDAQTECTNIYSPKNKELDKLYVWVTENVKDKRLH